MTQIIDFYFDVGSPASYLAWTKLPALALCDDPRTQTAHRRSGKSWYLWRSYVFRW